MTTAEITDVWPNGITLARGSHRSPDDGLCFMEAVSFFRGLPHTDCPPCVSPVLGAMGRRLNDGFPDDLRQMLVPLIPLVPGTAGDGHDETRGYMALDWLMRTCLPAYLDHVPSCRENAAELRALSQIVDSVAADRARPIARRAKAAAAAAAYAAAAADADADAYAAYAAAAADADAAYAAYAAYAAAYAAA